MSNCSSPAQAQLSRKSTLSFVLIVATAVATGLSFIGAPYPDELKLQHAPTVLILLGLGVAVWRRWLGSASVHCVLGFLGLHIIGARWIYSFVPYDSWTSSLFGVSLSDQFGWRRNHYDRLVHFGSGLLLVPPAAEVLQRYGGMTPRGAAVQAIAVVVALGALYEIMEWLLAVTLSPERAEAYNGQQGDVWDPQKDLLMAAIGSVIAAAIVWRRPYRPSSG